MNCDLTRGGITGKLLKFALPLMIGNLLQQFYNIADTFIVGRFIGPDALAAVGSSYTLMTFLTSVLLGLCMGSSAYFAMQFGRRDFDRLRRGVFLSFLLIGALTLAVNAGVFLFSRPILRLMRVPAELRGMMLDYLLVIFCGILATFLYNFCANLLRAVGNTLTPLLFLGCASILNILLDALFVLVIPLGVRGAAIATVISQYVAGAGIAAYALVKRPDLRPRRRDMGWDASILRAISSLSILTCVQQSVMNFGILMIQGLVNSFGPAVMSAFAAAVKIDSFAYMPVQDFGNAFSTFVAQNHGAGRPDRIRRGVRSSVLTALVFCAAVSSAVCLLAEPLMRVFVDASRADIIAIGAGYLRIEASFYFGIGLLFLLYGYYRAIGRPGMSVVLTVCSLGTRVLLAYALSPIPALGVTAIWAAIPIGWFLADAVGVIRYWHLRKREA